MTAKNLFDKQVSFVLTSCNRFDLLEKTIRSFLKYNTYPIQEYIIIEDSPYIEKLKILCEKFPQIRFTLLNNNPQLGQLPSIDKAYQKVKTEYIFHCEDDWEFFNSNFIEKSLDILEERKDIFTVWIREQNDTNKHPVEKPIHDIKGEQKVEYKLMSINFREKFHGFTFNPGLRRYSDYELLKPYSQYQDEEHIGQVYFNKYGFRGAILLNGAVKHLGNHRKIKYDINSNQGIKLASNIYKRVKSKICKILNI